VSNASATANDQIAEPPGEQANMQIAFAAVLATRQETFLAHCPRSLKLGVLALILFGAIQPFLGTGKSIEAQQQEEMQAAIAHNALKSADALDDAPAVPAARPAMEKVELKTEAEKTAAAFNDSNEPTTRMGIAPDLTLIEETPAGRLPKISVDGRKPWQAYARPFNYQDPRPRIAIVIGDLGFSRVATDATLRRLPPSITLAFDAQANAIDSWLQRARQDGHETLLSLPMEPFDYPRSDPGPNSLLTSLPNADNIQRLNGFLRIGAGYTGVTTLSGSRFSTDSNKLMPVIGALHDRGLLVLDTRVATHSTIGALAREMKVPVALSSRVIDVNPTPAAIDEALSDLEQTARIEGSVVGIASPLPLSLDRIEAWSKQLAERGFVLAPVSAVVK